MHNGNTRQRVQFWAEKTAEGIIRIMAKNVAFKDSYLVISIYPSGRFVVYKEGLTKLGIKLEVVE